MKQFLSSMPWERELEGKATNEMEYVDGKK